CILSGDLVCCDGCPRSFHAKCLGVKSAEDLEDPWYCKVCVPLPCKSLRSVPFSARRGGAWEDSTLNPERTARYPHDSLVLRVRGSARCVSFSHARAYD
ncbi:hypothetical protein T484DRAFT_3628751, partial [Baffinella frigidus]